MIKTLSASVSKWLLPLSLQLSYQLVQQTTNRHNSKLCCHRMRCHQHGYERIDSHANASSQISERMELMVIKESLVLSIIFEDNQSCLSCVNVPIMSTRNKHLALNHHFFRSFIGLDTGIIAINMPTLQQANTFTKGLPEKQFVVIQKLLMGWQLHLFLTTNSPSPFNCSIDLVCSVCHLPHTHSLSSHRTNSFHICQSNCRESISTPLSSNASPTILASCVSHLFPSKHVFANTNCCHWPIMENFNLPRSLHQIESTPHCASLP